MDAVEKKKRRWNGMTCESRSKQARDEEMELDLS